MGQIIGIEDGRVESFLNKIVIGQIYSLIPPLKVNDERLLGGNTTSCYFYAGRYLGSGEGDWLRFEEISYCRSCQAEFRVFFNENVTLRPVDENFSGDDILA
jgi:hypothetical protein